MNDDDKRDDFKEPPTWWLGLGIALLLAGLVLLMLLPENSFGF